MKKVMGYVRVSTGHQVETGLGLADQRAKIKAYCELYDLDLIEIIADEGYSGRSLRGRTGVQQLIDRIDTYDGIVIAKLDRLTRSVRDLQSLLDAFSKKEIHSVSEKIDTSSPTGRLILNVLTSVASWESEISGERTSSALQAKQNQAQQAEHERARTEKRKPRRININGRPPYGYTWNNGELCTVESEQTILNIITERRIAGIPYAKIATELSELGHRKSRNHT